MIHRQLALLRFFGLLELAAKQVSTQREQAELLPQDVELVIGLRGSPRFLGPFADWLRGRQRERRQLGHLQHLRASVADPRA